MIFLFIDIINGNEAIFPAVKFSVGFNTFSEKSATTEFKNPRQNNK